MSRQGSAKERRSTLIISIIFIVLMVTSLVVSLVRPGGRASVSPGAPTTVSATMAVTPLDAAESALRNYFSLLHAGRYAEAATHYGGNYEVLQSYNPGESPDDHAALLRDACTVNGFQCLAVHAIKDAQTIAPDTFQFSVEFDKADGSLLVQAGCCGAETSSTPQFAFTFTVKRVDGRYLVQELPVYTP